jgi:hypothetical protein
VIGRFKSPSFKTDYDLFVMLGDPNAEPPWLDSRWRALVPWLEQLMTSARQAPAALARFKDGGRIVREAGIEWSDEGHRQWTIAKGTATGDRHLASVEVWAPPRETCEKDDVAPDLFLGIRDESVLHPGKPLSFNPYLVLAVPADGRNRSEDVRRAALSISTETHALLRAHARRPWGLPFGSGGYSDVIGDMMITDVFKVGDPHAVPPSLDSLEGSWRTF